MNDSVREEMSTKVAPSKPLRYETRGNSKMINKPSQPLHSRVPKLEVETPKNPPSATKQKTPNLFEFQNKNATLPEWRLQLQNAVRKRQEEKQFEEEIPKKGKATAPKAVLRADGNAALKAEPVQEASPINHSDPRVQNALRRIETSRKQFSTDEEIVTEQVEETAVSNKKDYPFYIAARNAETVKNVPATRNPVDVSQKTRNADSLRNENGDFDTNKLPPLSPPAEIANDVEIRAFEASEKAEVLSPKVEKQEIKIEVVKPKEVVETQIVEVEEADDVASFGMRFNAGLFDLIIGSFASFVLLSPFILFSGNWFTVSGFFAFLATTAIVMFVYLTASVGLFGKTFGMRMFSLEVIDIEEEDYPSLHQAAVSSSVYLLSLAVGGIGFLTMMFNDEKRAIHDIVSGTMTVKEL